MAVDLLLHERIKCRLRERGSSMAQVARTCGVLPSTVTVVSQGYRKSSRILEAIAHELGEEPAAIWPARFASDARVKEH